MSTATQAGLASAIFFLTSQLLPACDLCAVYNSASARGEGEAGFHLAIAEQFTRSKTLQEEGHKRSDPVDQFRDSSITTVIVGYNFNERFGIGLNIPYIHRRFRRAEGLEVERGHESGLGDVSLIARAVAYKKAEHHYSFSLSFLAGVEFPTGDSDLLEEETEEEAEIPGAPPSGVHGNDLALGSGSFDGIVGMATHFRWRRFLFSTDTQYFIRTRGDFEYRYGNELTVSGGPGVYLWFSEERTLALQGVVTYESKSRDQVAGDKRNDGIVTGWYAGPGLIFTWGSRFSLTANLDLPLDIQNRAFQVVPDWRARAGLSWQW